MTMKRAQSHVLLSKLEEHRCNRHTLLTHYKRGIRTGPNDICAVLLGHNLIIVSISKFDDDDNFLP